MNQFMKFLLLFCVTIYHVQSAGLIVPLYIYPTYTERSSSYTRVANLQKLYPNVKIVAIVNPGNGPGASVNSDYTQAIDILASGGVTIIGYVHTTYANRSSALVETDIANWKLFYPKVNGLFFDEVINDYDPIKFKYYTDLVAKAKTRGFNFFTANPGWLTYQGIVDLFNMTLVYESKGLPDLNWLAPYWNNYKSRGKLAIIPYGVPTLPDKVWFDQAIKSLNYFYITSDDLPNPWDSLPSYLENQVKMLNNYPLTNENNESLDENNNQIEFLKLENN